MDTRKLPAVVDPQAAIFGRYMRHFTLSAAVAAAGLLSLNRPVEAFSFFDNDRPYLTDRPFNGPPRSLPNTTPRLKPGQQSTSDRPQKRRLPPVRARVLSESEKRKYEDLLSAAKKGSLLAAVSLNDQELTLYADGVEIARSRVSSGTASHPTPTGIFSIIQKNLFHRSNLYSDAPMPFMQRITWSGVALHQGVLPGYPASHGCIRMPEMFSRQFWAITRLGVRVTVTRAAVTPADFSHATLFTLPQKPAEDAPQAGGGTAAPAIKLAEGGASTATDAAPAASGGTPEQPSRERGFQMDARTLRPGPITVFISRKENRLFVRKGFSPLFDAPVTIAQPEQPIGTHLFTLKAVASGAPLLWTAVSMPSHRVEGASPSQRKKKRKKTHNTANEAVEVSASTPALTPAAALDRITIEPELRAHITRLMSAGASVIISDQGLGSETGLETDFVISTR